MTGARSLFFISGLFLVVATISHAADGQPRDQIRFDDLFAARKEAVPLVHNRYFLPVGPSADALHRLSGKLAIAPNESFAVKGRFPRFEVSFFTCDGYLVPTERELISPEGSIWDIILSPGRVWSEATDRGWSRAAFPFVLAGRTWNESHNGLATFVFNDNEVSDLRVQIVQEAASWARFDAADQLAFEYVPGEPPDDTPFRRELERAVPIEPLSRLSDRVSASLLQNFEGLGGDVTFAGLFADGVLYSTGCHTRLGEYPFCREMRHGVFSVTKTMGAALSLLWLANRYGDSVASEKIADHLKVTAKHNGWSEVTFLDALNMTTGIGDKAPNRISTTYNFEADESSPVFTRMANARTLHAKLAAAFEAGNYEWGPGEVGRYNSVHTFVLAAAMDAYLKEREGPQSNLWDRVRDEVLVPIGIEYAPMMHTRETDGTRGVPIMGWGYYPTAEELVRLARLFQNRGVFEGRQLISASLLESVFPGPRQGGYDIPASRYGYHKAFWLVPFDSKPGCALRIPEMMGYGGNLVTLMPNATIGIRLADAAEDTVGMYDSTGMMRVSNALSEFCD